MYRILIPIACLFFQVQLIAAEVQTEATLSEAQQALETEQYAVAVNQLNLLFAEGYASADMYYNLGLAYYKLGEIGPARLAWERGLRLRPLHNKIRYNLSFLLRDHPDAIQPMPVFFLNTWWRTVAGLLTPNVWVILGFLLLWSGATGLAWFLLGRTQRRKSIISLSVTLMLLAIIPFLLALNRQNQLQQHDRAVLTQRGITLRAAPEENSTEEAELNAGWKMRIIDTREGWHKVRLEDGTEGWLREGDIDII